MIPLDYGRSFLIGNGPENEVRFRVESHPPIINKKTDGHQDYIQVRSCESEHTFAEKNLFRQDNYDYLLIFGPDNGIIFFNGQKDTFTGVQQVEALNSNQATREATIRSHHFPNEDLEPRAQITDHYQVSS